MPLDTGIMNLAHSPFYRLHPVLPTRKPEEPDIVSAITKHQVSNQAFRENWLSSSVRSGRLCFVVGAGISKAYGIPTWNGLLGKLGVRLGRRMGAGQDIERAITRIKKQKFNDDSELFHDRIYEILYEKRKRKWDRFGERRDLEAVAMVALKMCRFLPPVQIISFNYDSYLEEFLWARGIRAEPYFRAEEARPTGDVLIYHPHGYLPHDEAAARSDDIVLDQASFSKSRSSVMWSLCKRTLLENLPVFVGLSGDCPNCDALIRDTQELRAKNGEERFWGICLCEDDDVDAFGDWGSVGLFGVSCGKRYTRVGDVIATILRRA
jgi:hypothetical protein